MNIQSGQNTQFLVLNLAGRILTTSLSRVNENSKLSKEDLAPYSYRTVPPKKKTNITNVQLLSNDESTAIL